MTEAQKSEILESDVVPDAESDSGAGGGGLAAAGGFWMALLVWLIVLLVPGAGLLGVVFVPVMIWLMYLKRPYAVWLLLFSPFFLVPVFCWNMGIFGYMSGTGKMIGIGLMTGRTIDRHTGVVWTSLGCEPWGYEPMIFIPNNLAIHTMTALLGPMRGAYDGPYPTLGEAEEALTNAKPVNPYFDPDSFELVVDLDGKGHCLNSVAVVHFLEDSSGYQQAKEAKAVLVDDRCLILDVAYSYKSSPDSIYRMYYLSDVHTGLLLCRYNPVPC